MSIRQRALNAVSKAGLELPERPDEQVPELPADITALPDADLMALLVELTAWSDYAAGVVAEYAIEEDQAASETEAVRARTALQHRAQKSVTAQKAAALADPEVRGLSEAHQLARAKRRFAEVVRDGAERKAAVVSRELTRRVGRHDRETRSNRWSS